MIELQKAKISEFGKIVTGKTPSSSVEGSYGDLIPFVTPSDNFDSKFITNCERYLSEIGKNSLQGKVLEKDSIFVTCIGSAMGKVAMATQPSITNQQINSIECNEFFEPNYVYYLLKNNYKLLRNAASGSTAVPILNKTDFENLEILIFCDKGKQQKIASVLSTLDEKIALNNQINAKLEQMAKTLYDYWFVQFDFPDDNGKPYKSSGGEMVYNETLKRDIPKGWEVKEIQDFCRIFTGKKDVNQASEMGQYKFFSCAPNFKYSNEKLFEGKAILVSGNGSYTGRTIFVNDAFDLYQRTYAVVSKTDLDVLEYIFYSMLRSFVPKVSGGTHGSAIPYIVFNDIAKETILFHENVVDRFMHIIINIQKQVIDLSEQNYKLTEMRDWLLPMLMNGQVTVQ